MSGWDAVRGSGIGGTGNWEDFDIPLDVVFEAARDWKSQLGEVNKPWLCWCLDDKWSLVQQKIILDLGWTPVVGYDPNCFKQTPKLANGAVFLDFNRILQLEVMWPHFPMEFAFLWAERLGFWHADLLLEFDKIRKYARIFENLKENELAAVKDIGGRRNFLSFKKHRYWELLGCTTKGASKDQFEKGCGWWRHISRHPNCPQSEFEYRKKHNYDHGVGIMYWKREYKGSVVDIALKDIAHGHFSQIGSKIYIKGENKSEELRANFELEKCASKLGLERYL